MSLGNIFRGRPILDIDYLVDEIFVRRIPLCPERLRESPMAWTAPVSLSCARTREVYYHSNHESCDIFRTLKAVTAAPLLYNRTVRIGDVEYWDGYSSDPIPLGAPQVEGTRRIIILTHPIEGTIARHTMKRIAYSLSGKRFRSTMMGFREVYAQQRVQVRRLRDEGHIVIAPPHELPSYDNSPRTITSMIRRGYEDGVSHGGLRQLVDSLRQDVRADFYFEPY